MTDTCQAAKQTILGDDIDVVSFDLFDTLVFRPLFSNREHLLLFCTWARSEYQIDIEAERLSAASEMNDPYATLELIWRHIAEKKNFSLEFAKELMEEEFKFDLRNLCAAKLGMELYQSAMSAKKRIIVLSDMYYSSSQISQILHKCGYFNVSAIYVSCEKRAVKRSGDLFRVAVQDEGVWPSSRLLHLGDNYSADSSGALCAGVTALHIPSNRRWFEQKWALIGKSEIGSVYESAVYGTALHWLAEKLRLPHRDDENILLFSGFVLFPMLIHAAIVLHTDATIQDRGKYNRLNFVSRDGFLMKSAYDALSFLFPDATPSQYLYTSRISGELLTQMSIADRLQSSAVTPSCTLERFIQVAVGSDSLRERMLAEIDALLLCLSVRQNLPECRRALEKYHSDLESDLTMQRQATTTYYRQNVGDCQRVLLVDCGFRGTISRLLTEGFHGTIKFDKFFLWEKRENRENDARMGTRTFTLFKQKTGHCLAPMAEAFFSDPGGSCIGFKPDPDGLPVPRFDDEWYPREMRAVIDCVQSAAMQLIYRFVEQHGAWLKLFPPSSFSCCFSVYKRFARSLGNRIFDHIRYKESFSPVMEEKTLLTMIYEKMGSDNDQNTTLC